MLLGCVWVLLAKKLRDNMINDKIEINKYCASITKENSTILNYYFRSGFVIYKECGTNLTSVLLQTIIPNRRHPKVRFFGNLKKRAIQKTYCSFFFFFFSNFSNLNDFCLDLFCLFI